MVTQTRTEKSISITGHISLCSQRNLLQQSQQSFQITAESYCENMSVLVCFDLPFSMNAIVNATPQDAWRTNNTHCVLFSTFGRSWTLFCHTALFTVVSPPSLPSLQLFHPLFTVLHCSSKHLTHLSFSYPWTALGRICLSIRCSPFSGLITVIYS